MDRECETMKHFNKSIVLILFMITADVSISKNTEPSENTCVDEPQTVAEAFITTNNNVEKNGFCGLTKNVALRSTGDEDASVVAGGEFATATSVSRNGLAGGGAIGYAPCIGDAELLEISGRVERNRLDYASQRQHVREATPAKFSFYPVAGRLYQDLFINNFVDLDPSSGILDWDCTNFTYNGHDAHDVDIGGFAEQAIGVPIFAALDGVVAGTNDGCDDMNKCPGAPCSSCANYVIIDHAGGRRTIYYHMKKGSIAVSNGQHVRAGEQIGLVGSSGNSSNPHLHFATYDDGRVVEPNAGPCRPGESEWIHQTLIERNLYVRDFGLTYEDMSSFPGFPNQFPRSGQIALSDPFIHIWALLANLPANSSWRIRFQRPNGTIVFDTGTVSFQGGNNPFYRSSWWRWQYNIFDMHQVAGTWHIELSINGAVLVEAPIEVRVSRTSDFNRPPAPITISLQPSTPSADDVIVCFVDTDLVLDDLDYDIVRYRYVWTVHGQIVRDVETASRSDVIPHDLVSVRSTVTCEVTPSDGKATGLLASISAMIEGTDPDPPIVENVLAIPVRDFQVTVEAKVDGRHPQYNLGSEFGYVIDDIQGKTLYLLRGVTYRIHVNDTVSHPFYISTSPIGAGAEETTNGVGGDGNFIDNGTLEFTPNANTPKLLYYQCQNHPNMGWKIYILDAPAAQLITTENGASSTLNLTLSSMPSQNVTITVASNNTSEGVVDETNVIFTPANWDVAQPITIRGVNDSLTDGSRSYGITINTSSIDAAFDGLTEELTAVNLDGTGLMQFQSIDIDGNGQFDALTDGLLIMRYLFGFRDSSLVEGAIGPNSGRDSAADIQDYLSTLMPFGY